METWFLSLLMIVCCARSLHCMPHSSCKLETDKYGTCLDCKEIDIPTSFDVKLIPAEAQMLRFHCPSPPENNYCNVLGDDSQPLPAHANLTEIILKGFRSPNHSRPSYDALFKTVKGQLINLWISYSRIGYLDADFFRGFFFLKGLVLLHNDISVLSPDAFTSMVSPGAAGVTYLHFVDLSQNTLEHVDLTAFEPIAGSLDWLDLSQQRPGLQSLGRSGAPFHLSLKMFKANTNRFTIIPKEVLDTVNGKTGEGEPSSFIFGGNTLCAKSDCTCCEMKGFLQWTERQNTSAVHFECGGRYWTAGGTRDCQRCKTPWTIHHNWFASCA